MHTHQFGSVGKAGKGRGEIRDMASTTGKDYAGELIGAIRTDMLPHVGNDFLITGLYDTHQRRLADAALITETKHGIGEITTLLGIGTISGAIAALQLLGLIGIGSREHNIGRGIVASKRNHHQMAQGITRIDSHRGGLCSYIHQGTSCTSFGLRKEVAGKAKGRDEQLILGNTDTRTFERLSDAVHQAHVGQHIDKLGTEYLGLHAYGRGDTAAAVGAVFLGDSLENLHIGILLSTVHIIDSLDDRVRNDSLLSQGIDHGIHCSTKRLSAQTHIDLSDLHIQMLGQLAQHILQDLCRAVYIVNDSSTNGTGVSLLGHGQYMHSAVQFSPSCNGANSRRTQFYSYDDVLFCSHTLYLIFIIIYHLMHTICPS